MHPTSASKRGGINRICGSLLCLSSVRVILTCSPSGHSEEHDEREEMIPCELDLSVLVATTPTWNPPLTPYWCLAKDNELVGKLNLLVRLHLDPRFSLPANGTVQMTIWKWEKNCCDQFACQIRSQALSFPNDIRERARVEGAARFCSRPTSGLAEAGREPALCTNILHL